MDKMPVFWDGSARLQAKRWEGAQEAGVWWWCCAMSRKGRTRTNIQQDGAIELLVDDMGLEDLVVEGLWRSLGNGHCATAR